MRDVRCRWFVVVVRRWLSASAERINVGNQHERLLIVVFGKDLISMVAQGFGLALCAHGAREPRHVNINRLSTTVEDVVVPLSNDRFGGLNQLGAVNWTEHGRSDEE